MVADLDLHREVRRLFAEMALVSEAPAARLDGDGSSRGRPQGGAPVGPAESMLDRWAARFAGVLDEDRLRVLLHLARRELLSVRKSKPVMLSRNPDTGEVQRDARSGDPLREDSWQRDERIVDWYEGVPAVEAALLESTIGACSAANIRRVRAANDRHRETGRPVEPSERRLRRARQLDAAGYSERRIAREMGVSRGTVRRLLERESVDRRVAA